MMRMNYIKNRTYDEIKVGDSATITRAPKPAPHPARSRS